MSENHQQRQSDRMWKDHDERIKNANDYFTKSDNEAARNFGHLIKIISLFLFGAVTCLSYVMWESIFVEKAGERFQKTIFAPLGISLFGRARIFHPVVKIILFLPCFLLFYIIATPIPVFFLSLLVGAFVTALHLPVSSDFLFDLFGHQLSPFLFFTVPITDREANHLTLGLGLLGGWALIAAIFSVFRMRASRGLDGHQPIRYVDHPGYVINPYVFLVIWALVFVSFYYEVYIFSLAALLCAITFSFHRASHHVQREQDAIDRSIVGAQNEAVSLDVQQFEEKARKKGITTTSTTVALSTPSKFSSPRAISSPQPKSDSPPKNVSPVEALLEVDDGFKSRTAELLARASDHTISANERRNALNLLNEAARETLVAHKEAVDSDKDDDGGMGPKALYSAGIINQMRSRGVSTADSQEVEV